MTIWCMSTACRITEATSTDSEYVILIAFPRQQWMHDKASVPVYVLSQTNHVPTITFKLHFNITFLYRDSSDLVSSGFPAKLFYAFLCPLIGATSHDHLIPMKLVVPIIFHESSSLRRFFYTFPLLLPFQVGTSILLRTHPQTHSSYIMMTAFWDVTTCPLEDRYHVFEGLSASILSLLQAHPYTLMMENSSYFETSVPAYQTKQHNVKEIHNLNNH